MGEICFFKLYKKLYFIFKLNYKVFSPFYESSIKHSFQQNSTRDVFHVSNLIFEIFHVSKHYNIFFIYCLLKRIYMTFIKFRNKIFII